MIINFGQSIFEEGIIVFPTITTEPPPRQNPLDVIQYVVVGPSGPSNIQTQGTIGSPDEN